MSTIRLRGRTLGVPAFHTPTSRAPGRERVLQTPHRSARSLGTAAWLSGIAAVLMLALAFSSLTPAAMAAPSGAAGASPSSQAIVEVDGLALRNGAGINCPVIERLPQGATVTVISGPTQADGYHWYEVTYNGKTGYAAGEYLSIGTGQTCPTGCANLTAGGYAAVQTQYLNMRCGPSINCPVSMSLPQGTVVKLLDGPTASDGYHWWHVSYNNQTGYMAGEYLQPANGPGTTPQSCTSNCGLVAGSSALVTSLTLNLRSGAGLNCPIIAVMPQGATVQVLNGPTQADGYTWYKVSYNGQTGYAAGDYLQAAGTTSCQSYCGSPEVGQDAYVKDTPYLHLRNGAGLSCDVETSIPQGDKVHVMDGPQSVDGYDWYHVTYTDQDNHDWDGYAAGDWLGMSS
jgi:uncharacterized protein YgiM (DUF1202 family)